MVNNNYHSRNDRLRWGDAWRFLYSCCVILSFDSNRNRIFSPNQLMYQSH